MLFHVTLQVVLRGAFILAFRTLVTPHVGVTDKFVPVVSVVSGKDFTAEFTRNFLRIVGYLDMTT